MLNLLHEWEKLCQVTLYAKSDVHYSNKTKQLIALMVEDRQTVRWIDAPSDDDRQNDCFLLFSYWL